MKILLLLFIFIFSFCINKKKEITKADYFYILTADSYIHHTVFTNQTESTVYSRSKELISELGEYHWRGLCHPDKNSIGNCGKFHSNEQGDATFQTGVYLMSLAWKYKNTKDSEILLNIEKLLAYYELHQSLNNGGLARSFVADEYYQKFPESEKNGTDIFQIPEVPGNHMRYRSFIKNGKTYWQRYDMSVDAVSHATAGLYWIYKFTPYSDRAKNILKKQYDFYIANNWQIKDDSGNILRFGLHDPSINYFSRVNKIIYEKIVNNSDIYTSVDSAVLNSISAYNKELRTNYFNSYVAFTQYLVLNDIGKDIKTGVKKLWNQVEGDDNFFANGIYNYIYGNNEKILLKNFPYWNITYGHSIGTRVYDYSVPLRIRKAYNKWEFSPFESYVIKLNNDDMTGNVDFLQAYWLY